MNTHPIRSKILALLIAATGAILIAGWVLLATARGGATAGSAPTGSAQPAWAKDPERIVSGDVQVALTPRGVSDGVFRVDVLVNTHSGDLGNLDLQAATELRVGGRSYRPLQASTLGGHHAGGRLEFALERVPDAFEIVIRRVRTMGDFTFRWP